MGFLDLFRGRPTIVEGTQKLPEGHARKIDIGDPLAGTGKQIVLCRVDGVLYALDTKCPHEGGRISDGPLVEWILRSGFSHDEVAVIQPEYAAMIAEMRRERAREKKRLIEHFHNVERQLSANTPIALEIALNRLKPHIEDGRVTIAEIGRAG